MSVQVIKHKPCFFCKKPSEVDKSGVFFDHKFVFAAWSSHNKILCDGRSRFDGVREKLKWAALDETEEGAHAMCALFWAVSEEGFITRYPVDGVDLSHTDQTKRAKR